MNKQELNHIANEVRKSILKSVYNAQSGHSGSSLSIVEILTVLYFNILNLDLNNLQSPYRDRFILSKGHAVPALYGVLVEKGIIAREELLNLRKLGSLLPGHPNMNLTPGIDMSTGSLGQGISAAVGMALAAKIDNKDYNVYTLLGDGELEEGQIWEASMFASNKNLDNLILLIDNNDLQIDGTLEEVNSPYPIVDKFKAFGFETIVVEDGHDVIEIERAFKEAQNKNGKPKVIIFKTVKGKGVSFMENKAIWHRKKIKEDEYNRALKELEENEKKSDTDK